MSSCLAGVDGNAFAVLGKTQKMLRRWKISQDIIDTIIVDAKSNDYVHLLAVCVKALDEYKPEEDTE